MLQTACYGQKQIYTHKTASHFTQQNGDVCVIAYTANAVALYSNCHQIRLVVRRNSDHFSVGLLSSLCILIVSVCLWPNMAILQLFVNELATEETFPILYDWRRNKSPWKYNIRFPNDCWNGVPHINEFALRLARFVLRRVTACR